MERKFGLRLEEGGGAQERGGFKDYLKTTNMTFSSTLDL